MLDFYDLNARHAAAIISGTLFLFYAFFSSREVRRSFLQVLRAVSQPTMVLVIIGLICSVSIIVALWTGVGRHFGLWETVPLVTTSFWVALTGFSMLAILSEIIQRDKALRNRIMSAIALPTVFGSVLGFAILPIWLEIVLAPMMLWVAVAYYRGQRSGKTLVPAAISAVYVLGLISWTIVELVNDPSRSTALIQGIALPIILMLGTIPYIEFLVMVEKLRFSVRTKSKRVTFTEYRQNWPLTSASAKLCCNSGAVWVETHGNKYWLNGWARTLLSARGYDSLDLTEIWLDQIDERHRRDSYLSCDLPSGLKVSISQLLHDGLDLERKPSPRVQPVQGEWGASRQSS